MPSAFAHGSVALAFGSLYPRATLPRWAWLLGAGCAVLPDLDVLSFRLGIPYGDVLGHRGLTHSVVFAGIMALVFALMTAGPPKKFRLLPSLFLFGFACTMSHGLLDAMTDGGRGVAFFAPFSEARYFLPWRPIAVSPLSMARLLSAKGMLILANEVQWVILPSALTALIVACVRHSWVQSRENATRPGTDLPSKSPHGDPF